MSGTMRQILLFQRSAFPHQEMSSMVSTVWVAAIVHCSSYVLDINWSFLSQVVLPTHQDISSTDSTARVVFDVSWSFCSEVVLPTHQDISSMTSTVRITTILHFSSSKACTCSLVVIFHCMNLLQAAQAIHRPSSQSIADFVTEDRGQVDSVH